MFSSVDTIWVLLGTALVFFMQAGFAMVETGFTRTKNAGNIIMKNLLDVSIGSIGYWAIGFGIMFGGSSAICGGLDLFMMNSGAYDFGTLPLPVFFIFQTAFCATAATIVSGAMAERTKFSTYCVFSLLISALVYPVSGHWIWGGGWLSALGFHDFAGSTAVHMVGGVASLVGAAMVGPRLGKYDKDGKPHAFPGHSITLGALGVFILWFAWFGFNGGSTLSMTGKDTLVTAGQIFVNTNMAAAAGAVAALLFTWFRYKKPDVSLTLNGALAGLVGVTAGCDLVSTTGAFWIGLICGIMVVVIISFVDSVLKIDDPVGAIGVHGGCGALGTLLTGCFAVKDGLFYGGGWHFLGVQALGVVSVAAWVGIAMVIIFSLLKVTMGLRVSQDEELVGLDIREHGMTSYADFMPMPDTSGLTPDISALELAANAAPDSLTSALQEDQVAPVVEVVDRRADAAAPISMVTVLTGEDRFTPLKHALDRAGITGMTVSHVHGCGMQRGHKEMYRGVELDSSLLPKVKIEMVVCKVPVESLVATIKEVLQTGHIGDGKIFITDVRSVIKVSTGQRDYDALQDEL